MARILMAILLFLVLKTINAQHLDIDDKAEMYRGKTVTPADTTSLLSAFKRGHFNGHFRYVFMSTHNQKGLKNYFANAFGRGLRYETANFHGFQFAVSGFYAYNIGSSNLGEIDSITGQHNRYEIGLFDVEDPDNKNDIDRLEELYLKYNFKNSSLKFGKQIINTPFINLQDSRMRPTGVDGLWFELSEIKHTKIEGGWLHSVSPRSTIRWYNAAESIGVYPTGVNIDGTKSGYSGNLKSNGIFLLGSHIDLNKNIKFQVWNLLTENIFNSVLFQTDFNFPLKVNNNLFASAQLIRQDAVNDGGNRDITKTYFENGGKAITFGLKAGWKNKRWETTLNFNRITKSGRFLMPREWGQEPFFTYLSRERNEGLGNVAALMAKVNYSIPEIRVKSSAAAGYYHLPGVMNYRLNKYGLPSYVHLRADVQYSFAGIMEGMDAQLLVVSKIREGETYNNKMFEFNKVNLINYNVVLNYHF